MHCGKGYFRKNQLMDLFIMESKEKRRYLIETGIGLQAVDGLNVSEYFLFQADRYIEGEITLKELEDLVGDYHKSKPFQGIYLSNWECLLELLKV